MDFALQLFVSVDTLYVCTYGKCSIGELGTLQCCRIISAYVDGNGLLSRLLIDRFKRYIYGLSLQLTKVRALSLIHI